MYLTVDKRSGIWQIGIKTHFGLRRFSSGQRSKEKALQVARILRLEELETVSRIGLLRASVMMQVVNGKSMSSKECYEQWERDARKSNLAPRTVDRYADIVRVFLSMRGWPPISTITPGDVDEAVNTVKVQMHASTRNTHLNAISHFLKYSNNAGWCMNNAASNVKVQLHLLPHAMKEPKPRRPFTDDEFNRLIAVAKEERMPYWYGMLMVARYTGLRWMDAQNLERASVLPDRIIVWTDKHDRRVELPMPPELPPVFDLLAKHPLNQPGWPANRDQFIFAQIPVDVSYHKWEEWHRIRNAAGLPRELVPHCLRHTYATELAKSGMPIKEIAARLGHFATATTMKYLHMAGLPIEPWAFGKT